MDSYKKSVPVIALSTMAILSAMDLIAYAMLPLEPAEIVSKGMKSIIDSYGASIDKLLRQGPDTHD